METGIFEDEDQDVVALRRRSNVNRIILVECSNLIMMLVVVVAAVTVTVTVAAVAATVAVAVAVVIEL